MTNASNATMDENTVFVIGYNTKVFTAILLSDMVTNGLINLDDPIETYLPLMLQFLNITDIKSPSRI